MNIFNSRQTFDPHTKRLKPPSARVNFSELEWGDTEFPYWLSIPQYETERLPPLGRTFRVDISRSFVPRFCLEMYPCGRLCNRVDESGRCIFRARTTSKKTKHLRVVRTREGILCNKVPQ